MAKRSYPARPHTRRGAEAPLHPPAFLPLEARLLLDAKWTVMIYIDGDNDLESAAIDDFLEMAKVGSTADVKVVAELDRSPLSDTTAGYDTRYDDWSDTRRGLIQLHDVPNKVWGQSIGEADMASPATLTSFVNWGEANYPAENYAVVLWDHGDGYEGVCWDYTTSDTAHLSTADLGTAMAGFTKPVQLIGFDACLMSMMEVAYQVWDKAQVFVGSQETESTSGWSYNEVLGDLTANSSWTPLQFGADIVAKFKQDYDVPGALDTLSAIDLTKLGGPDGAAAALTAFTNEAMFHATADDTAEMGNLWWGTSFFGADDRTLSDYTDLGTFLDAVATDTTISQPVRDAAQAAMDAYTACIISNFSGEYAGSTGMSVYLPRQWAEIPSDYSPTTLRFAAETGWYEFLQWWNNGTTPAPKISLTGAGRTIQSGSAVASAQYATDFGVEPLGEDVVPDQYTHEFTITNNGNTTLHLTGTPAIQITGPAAGDFTVTTAPPDQLDPGESGTFTITFDPTTVGARNATVRIHSDDLAKGTYTFAIKGTGDAPTLSLDKDPIVVMEGNSGTTDAVFTVTISRDPIFATDVNYATEAGTADDGTDYLGVSGTLTFLPGGLLTQTVTVPVLGDTEPELDETFYLNLSGATKAAISATQGRGTCIIENDDGTMIPFGGTVKAVFNDPQDNDTVTVSLAGPSHAGQGTVLLDTQGNCLGIGVNGALATNTLTVTVRKSLLGDGRVNVRDIVIDGSVKSISAAAVNLTGSIRLTGLLGSLTLNNLTGGGSLDIDSTSAPLIAGAALTMTLGRVTDTAVDTHGLPIRSLTAIEWLNTPSSAVEQIAAPSLASLTIKGGGKAGPAGDFQAALLLDDSDCVKQTLGTVKIAGAVSGSEWDVTGAVGAITITGATSDWTLQGPNSDLTALASLTMGLVGANVAVDVDGTIGTLKSIAWVGGALTAEAITSLSTVGIAKTATAGDFGPAVRITGKTGTALALGTVKIAGAVTNSSWLVDGSVGTITVAGATTDWTLQGGGASGEGLVGVKSLSVGQATDCELQLQDVLGALKATSWTGGNIEANRLDALSVVGSKTLGVSGDFAPAELKLLGQALPLHKAALGSVSIAGNVQNSLWYVNGSAGAVTVAGCVSASDMCLAGGIASLTLGATDSSDFFAGLDFTKVDPTAIDLTKADPATVRYVPTAGDFIDPKAKIGSVTVRGLTVPKGQDPPRFVLDSNFSSPYFGAVKLTNPGGGDAYGLYTAVNYLHVASVTITDTLNHENWSWAPASGKPFPVVGSLVLQLV